MADGQVTKEAVEEALGGFKDPETGRDVVKLKQIHRLDVDSDRCEVTLGLTTFAAPLWDRTQQELIDYLKNRFPNLDDVVVRIEEHSRPAEKLGEIGLAAKSVIAVGSGKGGVGKSTIAATLACGLARFGSKVGLMDADVYGPSIPHLLGTTEKPYMVEDKIQPIEVGGLKVMSMGFLLPAKEAVIWRGPMLHGAITQFLRDTAWGELDYLIIDLPPGTGDISLTLSQLLPISGAVVVCTPQDLALLDAVKAITMFGKVDIRVLGVVENMSHFICPGCGDRHDIFGSGGAKAKAHEMGIPFLGEVPINMQLRVLGDEGKITSSISDEQSAPYLEAICLNLVTNLVESRREAPPMPSLSILK